VSPINTRILADLNRRLERIDAHMAELERRHATEIAMIPRGAQDSARNLVHYLFGRATAFSGGWVFSSSFQCGPLQVAQ
jgi:hypothetical protein